MIGVDKFFHFMDPPCSLMDEIPGLYAAGRTTSGLPTSPYIASGISVGDCTFFGRQAGIHAAADKA